MSMGNHEMHGNGQEIDLITSKLVTGKKMSWNILDVGEGFESGSKRKSTCWGARMVFRYLKRGIIRLSTL